MKIKSDIEIAQENTMNPISEVADQLGIDGRYVDMYGHYKAKIDYHVLDELKDREDGKLILVTAISPTPAGEGKTTMIRLILGLIHPEEGQAVLRDAYGNAVEMNAELRRYFAYVPQGNTILSGTIAENMRMVREDATDEQIVEALQIACA